jgi:hypothetical protein
VLSSYFLCHKNPYKKKLNIFFPRKGSPKNLALEGVIIGVDNLQVTFRTFQILYTVKPVYNGRPWDSKIEAVIDRWPLFRGRIYYTICNWAFKMVAFIARLPLFRGGR